MNYQPCLQQSFRLNVARQCHIQQTGILRELSHELLGVLSSWQQPYQQAAPAKNVSETWPVLFRSVHFDANAMRFR